MPTYLIINLHSHLLTNDSNGLKGVSGSILLHAGGKKGEGMFLYSAVSSPLDRSKHSTPWKTYSFRHQLGFSGKHSSHAAITRND